MRIHRHQRGSALVASMIVVLVIAAVAVAILRYATREVAGATAGRKEAALASCAESARSLLMSQWKLLGAHGVTVPALKVKLETASDTTVLGGHYGQDPTAGAYWDATNQVWINNVQVIPLNPLTVGSSYQVNDLSNRIGDPARSYRVVVHCTQAGGRESEVEFAVHYGL